MTYCCSIWFSPSSTPSHIKYILKSLPTIQKKTNRVITGAFKAKSLSALDIENFLLSISFKLDKLGIESLSQIISSQLFETIISKCSKPAQLKQLSNSKNLTYQFEKKSGLSIARLK